MVTDQIQIGETRPRFVILNENAAEHLRRGLYGGALFLAALLPLSLIAQVAGPAVTIVGYVIGMSAFGLAREAQRGYETPATLAVWTVTGRHLALGQLYTLDSLRAAISKKRRG